MGHDTDDEDNEFLLRISLSGNASSQQNTTSSDDPVVPEELCRSFHRDGFIALPNVLSLEDVDILNDRLEKVLRGQFSRHQKPDKTPRLLKSQYDSGQFSMYHSATSKNTQEGNLEGYTENQRKINHDDNTGVFNTAEKQKKHCRAVGPLGFSGNVQNVKVLQLINVHKADHFFRRLATSRALGKVVADLAGWKQGARLAQDQVWAKPPGAPPLVFHRDSPYFMFDDPAVVTVWVALDTMDEQIGPLEYVKGSHLWGDGRVGSSNQFFKSNGGMKLVQSAAEKEGISMEDIEVVSMAGLLAGGISIHDGRTWHGSRRNRSQRRPRRGLGLHFVPANVKFTREAKSSKLWKRYVENVEDLKSTELPQEDFPVTWKPG